MTRTIQKTIGIVLLAVVAIIAGMTPPQDVEARCLKVNACHNGQIKQVCFNELPVHLNHGDHFVGSEICDGRDNNCNGEIDEGLQNCAPQAICPCEVHPELINRIYQASGRGSCEVGEDRTRFTVLTSNNLRYTAQVTVDNGTARPVIWIGDFNNFNDPAASIQHRCQEEVSSQNGTCTQHILATDVCTNGG